MANREGKRTKNALVRITAGLMSALMLTGCGADKGGPGQSPSPSESAIPTATQSSSGSQDNWVALASTELPPRESASQAPVQTPEPVATEPAEQVQPQTDQVPPEAEPSEAAPAEPAPPPAEPAPEAMTPVPAELTPVAETIAPQSTGPTPVPKASKAIAPSAYMSYKELVGDNGDYSMPHNVPSRSTYKIFIDTGNQVMTIYEKATGKIVRQMLCTTGAKETPTPKGVKKMGKGRARFGFFKDYNCYAQYCTQVVQGIYIHSVLYRKKSAKTLIKSSYRNLGRPSSHGCIRLTVPDARWVFYNIAPGTECEIRSLKRNDALRKSLRLPAMPK